MNKFIRSFTSINFACLFTSNAYHNTDDMWDSTHELAFGPCIDTSTASRLLDTTRIKGVLAQATEVELELLGLQESVELLASVAELDAGQIAPVCLEIAQLCGRVSLVMIYVYSSFIVYLLV